MALIVNGEKINNELILGKVKRLRPDYQRLFHEQILGEQESQLLEWAKENPNKKVKTLWMA